MKGKDFLRTVRDLAAALFILYLSEILGMMAASMAGSLLNGFAARDFVYILVNTGAYIAIALILTAQYSKKVLKMQPTEYCPGPIRMVSMLKWMGATLIVQGGIILASAALFPGQWRTRSDQLALHLLRTLVDFGIGAAIVEEVIFRGVLLTDLERRMGWNAAIWVSSALFTALHLFNLQGGLETACTAVYTFALAVSFCLIRQKTGNLWNGMAVHGLWNFLFMGCISIGVQDEYTALIHYEAASELYLMAPTCAVVIACAALYIFNGKSAWGKKFPKSFPFRRAE